MPLYKPDCFVSGATPAHIRYAYTMITSLSATDGARQWPIRHWEKKRGDLGGLGAVGL